MVLQALTGLRLVDGDAHVAVSAPAADGVELCLFDDQDHETRHQLTPHDDGWHRGVIPSVPANTLYGYRTHGPWLPDQGLFHHPSLFLLDPAARAVSGTFSDRPEHHPDGDRADTAPFTPRSIAVETPPHPRPGPGVPWTETIIYETHVRGLSMLHPEVQPELRGTFRGAASEPILDHLLSLGVTTVELMPVAQHVTEPFLQRRGMTNYWGYSSLIWQAPHGGYATDDDGRQVAEFAEMVDQFHAAGLEVVLDVVFNHTAEGGADGPILSMKGLDNRGWYRTDGGTYIDWTGTGNTIDTGSEQVRAAILDTLRWWIDDLGVDGFRFDLGVSLGRNPDFDRSHLEWLTQDPVVARAKLIAEPWDLGPDGYRLGEFGPEFAEWNGKYRDQVRDLWRGHVNAPALVRRVAGSADIFATPGSSVNFVAAHDGFTLEDLVSYDHKHNGANGENNRDGHDDNRSWNSGAEGPTGDPAIREVRRRRGDGLLATLLLSVGVPMLYGGDELGRTVGGNNNPYPVDDERNWLAWQSHPRTDLIRRLNAVRRQSGVLGGATPDARVLSVTPTVIELSTSGHNLLIAINAASGDIRCRLPGGRWRVAIDTVDPDHDASYEGEFEMQKWQTLGLIPE